jgi:L-lysine exporter family protein LysE/ArgO
MVPISSLAWIYGAAVLAAAPIGPVNAVAIRRGLIGRWTHMLRVALGSMLVEGCYVTAALWGGRRVLQAIPPEALHRWVGLPAAGIITLLGLFNLRKAIASPHRTPEALKLERARQEKGSALRDFLTGALLTAINPVTIFYWLLGVGPAWLEQANVTPGSAAIWCGVAAAVAGLATWFTFVATLVRLRPQNVGPGFFRIVNAVCGMVLTAGGIALAVRSLLR